MVRNGGLDGDVLYGQKSKAQELSWCTRVLDKTPGDHRIFEAPLEITLLLASFGQHSIHARPMQGQFLLDAVLTSSST
jgi:hypothetical protein